MERQENLRSPLASLPALTGNLQIPMRDFVSKNKVDSCSEEHLRIISDFYIHIKSYPPTHMTMPTQVHIHIVVVSIRMAHIGPYI